MTTALKLYVPGSFADGTSEEHLRITPRPMLASFQLFMRVRLPLFDSGVFVEEFAHRARVREQAVLSTPGDFI